MNDVRSTRCSGAGTVGDDEAGYRWRWRVLAVVIAASVMDLLDGTVVNVAAPAVSAELGGGAAVIAWLAAAYTWPSGCCW